LFCKSERPRPSHTPWTGLTDNSGEVSKSWSSSLCKILKPSTFLFESYFQISSLPSFYRHCCQFSSLMVKTTPHNASNWQNSFTVFCEPHRNMPTNVSSYAHVSCNLNDWTCGHKMHKSRSRLQMETLQK
jgi:hypothetical protein